MPLPRRAPTILWAILELFEIAPPTPTPTIEKGKGFYGEP